MHKGGHKYKLSPTPAVLVLVVLPGQMEGSSLLETRGDSVDTMHGQVGKQFIIL